MEKEITYFGQKVTVKCDGECNKSWGRNTRPRKQLSNDPDDYMYYSNLELGEAPTNPGTIEGDDCKPLFKWEFPNKWCVRECERCVFLGIPTLIHDEKYDEKQHDWNDRWFNFKSRTEEYNKNKDK